MMRLVMGVALLAGLTAMLLLMFSPSDSPAPASEGGGFAVTDVLSGEDEAAAYPRVEAPVPMAFPDDHGPHPGYRHEWWYVTGNLQDAQGRHYGYQITFFRFNIQPDMPARTSTLATNQVWMAHLAVTDSEAGAFHHAERLSRGAAALAGASIKPFRVWLDDWSLTSADADAHAEALMPLRLEAALNDEVQLDLTLHADKPLVLQGDRGYSRKGRRPGNASRYYSYTRLGTEGQLTVNGRARAVTGSSWMDREWGSSPLDEEQAGWDWFSLQLDDGRDIMFYHLRTQTGGSHPYSKGLLVAADGTYRVLSPDEVDLSPERHWESPITGARYPVRWRLRIPGEGLDLALSARLDAQELRGGFRYWEGAMRVEGRGDGEVTGVGYAELTGY